MAEKIYQSRGIIPHEEDKGVSKVEGASKDFVDGKIDYATYLKTISDNDPNRRLYSERQFGLFKKEKWFRKDGWLVYELKQHKLNKNIPAIQTFKGWTPSFDFVASGFKLEDEVNLIEIGEEVENDRKQEQPYGAFQVGADKKGKTKLVRVNPSKLAYARSHVGTKELLEQNKPRIEQTFNRLNNYGIEFVVFRTYRGWPAVWDDLYFFSKGEVKD